MIKWLRWHVAEIPISAQGMIASRISDRRRFWMPCLTAGSSGSLGRRRLDEPNDYVRFEVRTALRRGVRVIPVLVEGARPPRQQELPPDLRRLARLNALEMSCDHRYQYDADRLMVIIERALEQ